MKMLIAITVLGLSVSGLAMANDRAGDFSWVEPTTAQPYDGQELGRHEAPEPTATQSGEGLVDVREDGFNSRA